MTFVEGLSEENITARETEFASALKGSHEKSHCAKLLLSLITSLCAVYLFMLCYFSLSALLSFKK